MVATLQSQLNGSLYSLTQKNGYTLTTVGIQKEMSIQFFESDVMLHITF